MRTSGRVKRYKLKSEINVVPYIDVMLVLLIIFMVTTPMLKSNVDVNLPQADAKSLKEKKDPVIVSVKADGSLLLQVGSSKSEPIDVDALKQKISAFVKVNPDVNVLVAGDADGKYGGVVAVMAELQQAGVSKVGLMAQPLQGKSTSHGRK
ncbi:MAG: protein TolR [Rhodanobacter sp.]